MSNGKRRKFKMMMNYLLSKGNVISEWFANSRKMSNYGDTKMYKCLYVNYQTNDGKLSVSSNWHMFDKSKKSKGNMKYKVYKGIYKDLTKVYKND